MVDAVPAVIVTKPVEPEVVAMKNPPEPLVPGLRPPPAIVNEVVTPDVVPIEAVPPKVSLPESVSDPPPVIAKSPEPVMFEAIDEDTPADVLMTAGEPSVSGPPARLYPDVVKLIVPTLMPPGSTATL